MSTFQPSAASAYGHDGARDYAAQTMLQHYQSGDDYGAVPPDVVSGLINAGAGLVTGIVGTVAGTQQANQQRDHEAAMMEQQVALQAQQAQIAQAQAAAIAASQPGQSSAMPIVLGISAVVAVGVIGSVIYFSLRK